MADSNRTTALMLRARNTTDGPDNGRLLVEARAAGTAQDPAIFGHLALLTNGSGALVVAVVPN